MEEDKIQSLHDSLSKLRKSAGLGISSHLNFGGSSSTKRKDGLPTDELYSNFVKEGLYDPTTKKRNDAAKYGDGRFIKRNFDDCTPEDDQVDDASSTCSSTVELKRKAEKKKKMKAAKLEAKRQAKLEEKKKAKLAAKRLSKKSKEKESDTKSCKSEASDKVKSKSKKSKQSKKHQNDKDDSKGKSVNDKPTNQLVRKATEEALETVTNSPKTSEGADKRLKKSKKRKIANIVDEVKKTEKNKKKRSYSDASPLKESISSEKKKKKKKKKM